METMIKSAAEFQLRALGIVDLSSSYVKSRPSDAPILRRLLETCIRVAPHIMPRDSAMVAPVLNHAAITLANLIVPPDGFANVTHAIDWQFTTISPFAMLCDPPQAVIYSEILIPIPRDRSMPRWPENFDELTPEWQDIIRLHHRYACRHRGYLLGVPIRDRLRGKVWALPQRSVLACLVPFMTRCIADGPRDLRGLLVELQEKWDSFADTPCLIDFSEDEMAAHAAEEEAHTEYTDNVNKLIFHLGLVNDCMVEPEHYEIAKAQMIKHRAEWDEREMKGPFPIYEGAHSDYLA